MLERFLVHLRANVVAYAALFVALGGTSYAAVRLAPNSVTSRAIAKGAVTGSKLAKGSVTAASVRNRSLTSADFKPGALIQGLKGDSGSGGAQGGSGLSGIAGLRGDAGPAGSQGPAGHDGSASIGLKARSGGSVTAPKGAATNIPLTSGTWTQSAGELDLITGNVTLGIPASCTGSFGNSVVLSVDGKAHTFAVAPSAPASSTVTVPFLVGTLSEPDNEGQHTVTAALANSCTKAGEDYTVSGLKLDVVKFR
jgi:hypothetical protein